MVFFFFFFLFASPSLTCCSVTQSFLTLGDPRDCSTPSFLVFHHLSQLTQTHVHWVTDFNWGIYLYFFFFLRWAIFLRSFLFKIALRVFVFRWSAKRCSIWLLDSRTIVYLGPCLILFVSLFKMSCQLNWCNSGKEVFLIIILFVN